MAYKKNTRAIKDFSGGLSEVANDNIPDNRLLVATNAMPGDGYGISRAIGTDVAYEKIDTEGAVVFMAELEENDTPHVIAATLDGGYWNLWDWSGASWSAIEYDNSDQFLPFKSWFVYAGRLFWLDGVGFYYYDGTAVDEVENDYEASNELWAKVQTAVAVVQRSTRWFFATKDNEVIISDATYYNRFTETNIIAITSGVTDSITALHVFNDGILIFQQRSIYYLTGWDPSTIGAMQLSKLSVESGTKWPKSIKTISNAVLYLGDNGVHRLSIPYYSSSIASSNISDKQASKRLTVEATDVYAEIFDGVYHIAIKTASDISEYRYYLNAGSWWGEYTQQPYCFAAKLMGDNHLYIGVDNGYILYYNPESVHYIATATGAPAAIPFEIVTKGYDVVGRTVIDAKVKRIFLVLKQFDEERSGLEVQVKMDYAEGAWAARVDSMQEVLTAVLREVESDESMVWSEGIYSQAYWGWIDTVTKMLRFNRKCKRVQFIFRDNQLINNPGPLLIYGVAIQYKRKKAKGSHLGVVERVVEYDD